MSVSVPDVRPTDDLGLVERLARTMLTAPPGTVGSLLPALFDDYARILHPAYATTPDGRRTSVRWSTIAAAKGRRLHPEAQFPSLVGSTDFENGPVQPDVWVAPPAQGTLPVDVVRALLPVLSSHTKTPERCWFASWEGFSDSRVRGLSAARIDLPGRRAVLLVGPLAAAATSLKWHDYQSANLWWPADLAWCVSTDIDHVSTYVAGSRQCIDDLLALPGVEAVRVHSDHGVFYDSDRLNPAPAR